MNQVKIPEGKKLVFKAFFNVPDSFICAELKEIRDRKWWQFWRPKYIILCGVFEDLPKTRQDKNHEMD
jgi:hypothetical protein